MSNSEPAKQIQVKITDEIIKGVYANAMRVSHNKEEFVMDFLSIYPAENIGVVNARIITNPSHMKRIISALQDNLKKYEASYGKIKEAEGPPEIGFKN